MVGALGEPKTSTEGTQAVEVLAERLVPRPPRQRPSELGAYWFGVLLVQVPGAVIGGMDSHRSWLHGLGKIGRASVADRP